MRIATLIVMGMLIFVPAIKGATGVARKVIPAGGRGIPSVTVVHFVFGIGRTVGLFRTPRCRMRVSLTIAPITRPAASAVELEIHAIGQWMVGVTARELADGTG
jgi:hypothetical protein